MERGTYPAKSMHQDKLELVCGMIGAGAAILTAESATAAPYLLAVRDNFYSSNTRTSTGLFVLTLKEMPPTILGFDVQVYNATGTTLYGTVRTWSLTAKTVTIDIRDGGASSAVADPTTSDHIRLTIIGRESTV